MDHKNYTIKLTPEGNSYTIHSIGKGALPKVLSGVFTSPTIAKNHIDAYLIGRGKTEE